MTGIKNGSHSCESSTATVAETRLSATASFTGATGDVFGEYGTGDEVAERLHQFLVAGAPSIVVCIGLNYKDHAAEMNKKLPEESLVFLKPPVSSLLLTGLTRDGVYLVEGGEITGLVNNFRFNESPIDLLRRFSHASATVPSFSREWGDDYFSRTATPALRVPDFNMSSVSQAQ